MATPKRATHDTGSRTIYPAHGDPIRIVPLNVPQELIGEKAAPAAAPQLTYRNGPLIANAEVFTIFWGAGWEKAPASNLITQLNDFFTFILTSSLIDQLSEYNVPGQSIGHGSFTGTLTITAPKLHRSVSDTAIQHMLQHLIATNTAVPQPSPNTLYFVYIQPGTKVVQGGSASCQSFCGYHNDISGQIFYAVMPYPGCAGCTGTMSVFDSLTSTSSHELCEAITDAIPGQGWYDDANGEIGDICAWKSKKIGQYTVQPEWSNKNNQCV
ncbi:MAG TPA: hypothetical protein VF011_16640 [Terriglobales bacterium]